MPLFCNTEVVLFLATKTRELKKRSLFVKKLVSQNAPRFKERTDLFSTSKEKEQHERKKRFLAFASENKKGKERERDEEEARDASSSSSAGGLFFTENDEKKHEFQDFEREQVLQFLPRSSFWVVVRTSATKTRFCERMSSGNNTRDNIASSSKFQSSSREDDRRW